MNRLAILEKTWDNTLIFDQNQKYQTLSTSSNLPKKSLFSTLIAQLYNPIQDVSFSYEGCGKYNLEEITERIIKYVEYDDDIITQFMSPSDIKDKIQSTHTFKDLLNAIDDILKFDGNK